MELVYLWVEEYKNIHKQGFTFSPRFKCKYDEENKKLSIDENDDYIENFFGKDINVTAIVGKNGSGKSNLLDLIFNRHRDRSGKEHFFVVYQDKKLQLYFFIHGYLKLIKEIKADTTCSMNILKKEMSITKLKYEFSSIFFSNLFQDLPIHDNTDKRHIDISTSYLIYEYSKNEEKTDFIDFKYQYSLYKSKSIENAILMLKEEGIILPFNTPKQLNINVQSLYIDEDEKDILLNEFQRLREKEDESRTQFYQYVVEAIIYNYCNFIPGGYSAIEDILKKDNPTDIDDFYKKIQKVITSVSPETSTFLEMIKELQKDKHYTDFLLSLDVNDVDTDLIKTMWNMSNSLFNLFDILHFNWKPDLSTGQEAYLFQFANFYSTIKNIGMKDDILILIDEGETTMHSNWQKQYIKYYVDFLETNFKDKNIHIILSSHSPFILSDLAKENVIFLDTYDEEKSVKKYPILNIKDLENGNCINVSEYININPFGANIHTLLSDGFFMEDGLMGEFAKNKIQEIIDYLNNQKNIAEISTSQEQIKKVIESIGEAFLKDKLLGMYDEKFIKTNEEKIRDLEQQIESIKNDQN